MRLVINFFLSTKPLSRILVFLWGFFIVFMSTYMRTEIFDTAGMGFAVFCYLAVSFVFLTPAALIEYKNNPFFAKWKQSRLYSINKQPKRYIGISRIATIICGIFVLIGAFIVFTEDSDIEESLPPTILFSILTILFGILSISSPKTKSEVIERKKLRAAEKAMNDCIEDLTSNTINSTDVSSIDGMNGHEFEFFCADLLRKCGFKEVQVTKGSGDQGVDILAMKGGIKYAIQCKNYASPLSNKPVQEVNAGKTLYNCHVGVVMTNSTFTPGAKELAQATCVLLWDRVVLQKMMNRTQ